MTERAAVRLTNTLSVPAAQIRNLHVSLGQQGSSQPVLRGINLDIAPGEIVGLVGESGSGKSVLALTMMGLLPQSSRPEVTGEITVAGTDMLHAKARAVRALRRGNLG